MNTEQNTWTEFAAYALAASLALRQAGMSMMFLSRTGARVSEFDPEAPLESFAEMMDDGKTYFERAKMLQQAGQIAASMAEDQGEDVTAILEAVREHMEAWR
jgi:hypothetical protein